METTSIAITPANPSVVIGKNLTFRASALPAGASQAVTWTSSDPTKAAIDLLTGVATGKALGSVAITATATDGSGVTATATLTVSDVTITLGDENLAVAAPAAGRTVTVANAPSAVASNIRAVKVNIATTANASIKIGNKPFTQGQTVNFSAPVTFTVTAQNGTAKSYAINIPAYHAAANPYGIYTVKQLVDVAKGLTASYLLKNNIDLPNADTAGVAATGISDYASKGWLPLGTSSAFTGTFDGGNFSINNFYVNREIEIEYAGLFGAVGGGGAIKNLGVNGVITKTAARGTHVGILAGSNEGTIDKCYATGNVSSSASASVFSAGGLVGQNYEGSINNSYATGSVSSSASASAGGLVGNNCRGSISNSYATGSVSASASASASAGGLVGCNYRGSIRNSYATGSVSASSSSYYSSAGGLVGGNINRGSISNSYATGSVSSSSSSSSSSFARYSSSAGGLVGDNYESSISNSYATGSVSSSAPSAAYAGGLVGGKRLGTITNCYRNSNAAIKKNNQTGMPNYVSIAGIMCVMLNLAAIIGITAKTKAYMQTDSFKRDLNRRNNSEAWGRNNGKNDNLPYIIGVGK